MASSRRNSEPTQISVEDIRPADYNPREISEEQFEGLKESLSTLGFVIPIIVNRQNKTIVAGHQRTKAAKALGMSSVPAYFVDAVTNMDECRYNQIHNSTSFTFNDRRGRLQVAGGGFTTALPDQNERYSDDAAVVKVICQLNIRYGNVLSAVCAADGLIVYGHAYVEACRKLHDSVNLYVLPDGMAEQAEDLLSREYGRFSYKGLQRSTWVQGMAQMKRLAADKTKKQNHSTLYENYVLPELRKEEKTLDFGAGKCAYADMLSGKGYDVLPLEFYLNDGKRLDIARAQRQIDEVLASVSVRGLFDKVVCDSVLNSVDSQTAYLDVIRTCCAMLRTGGTLYISGRNRADIDHKMRKRRDSEARNVLYYLDEDGFSATFRQGGWFFQKFDRREDVVRLLAENGLREVGGGQYTEAYQIVAVKESDAPEWQESVRREFDLPHPGGSFGRGDDAIESLEPWLIGSGA